MKRQREEVKIKERRERVEQLEVELAERRAAALVAEEMAAAARAAREEKAWATVLATAAGSLDPGAGARVVLPTPARIPEASAASAPADEGSTVPATVAGSLAGEAPTTTTGPAPTGPTAQHLSQPEQAILTLHEASSAWKGPNIFLSSNAGRAAKRQAIDVPDILHMAVESATQQIAGRETGDAPAAPTPATDLAVQVALREDSPPPVAAVVEGQEAAEEATEEADAVSAATVSAPLGGAEEASGQPEVTQPVPEESPAKKNRGGRKPKRCPKPGTQPVVQGLVALAASAVPLRSIMGPRERSSAMRAVLDSLEEMLLNDKHLSQLLALYQRSLTPDQRRRLLHKARKMVVEAQEVDTKGPPKHASKNPLTPVP